MFDYGEVLELALRRAPGSPTARPPIGAVPGVAADLGRRLGPPLPVSPALTPLLPGGLRRGSTVSVTGSVSLLLAVLGTASAQGAWCALVGLPTISAEAAGEYGIELSRLAIVPQPGEGWVTAVGGLLDAVDVVAARPPARIAPGDVRRLAARTRTRDAVLVPFLVGDATWPGAEARLRARPGQWAGIGTGYGRLRGRQVAVVVEGRGQAARPRMAQLWLPAAGGGAESVVASIAVGDAPTVGPGALDNIAVGDAPTVGPGALDGIAALRAG